MLYRVICIAGLVLAGVNAAADVLVLDSGESLSGSLIRIKEGTLTYKTSLSGQMTLLRFAGIQPSEQSHRTRPFFLRLLFLAQVHPLVFLGNDMEHWIRDNGEHSQETEETGNWPDNKHAQGMARRIAEVVHGLCCHEN